MPKIAKELKALAVSRLKETGFHPVGGVPGLLLCVKESGSRNWILRVTIGDKRRDVGLGGYPAVTLADARDKARETRDKIKAGGDPVLESKSAKSRLIAEQARQITFAEAVKGFLVVMGELEFHRLFLVHPFNMLGAVALVHQILLVKLLDQGHMAVVMVAILILAVLVFQVRQILVVVVVDAEKKWLV